MGHGLRLMTANLLHERCDADEFDALLERVSPDVVVAQELGPDGAEILSDRYPHHYLQPAREFTGRGVASVFQAEFGDIAMPVRSSSWALINIGGQLVRLVGMHLGNPIVFPWWRSAKERSLQLKALYAWTDSADDDVPLIVAGDMNASPAWPAYRSLASRWDDLVAGAADTTDFDPEPTWSWRPGWPRLLRIDHVFGMGVVATSCLVEPVVGSDHHAVVVDLELQ